MAEGPIYGARVTVRHAQLALDELVKRAYPKGSPIIWMRTAGGGCGYVVDHRGCVFGMRLQIAVRRATTDVVRWISSDDVVIEDAA
jgi:hypothetical protein